MLKTIFFDLGNVLVFFDHRKMYQQIAACSGLSLDAVKTVLRDEKIQERYESGKVDSAELYRLFRSRSSRFFSLHELVDAISDIFTPNIGLWPLVEQLKQEGLRLVLLSNTSECHFNRVYAHYPVLRLFDEKVLSFEVGCMKPDPRIFLKAISKADCAPHECFYTDDIPEFVAEAKKMGLDSIVFTDVLSLRSALILRGLKTLANL